MYLIFHHLSDSAYEFPNIWIFLSSQHGLRNICSWLLLRTEVGGWLNKSLHMTRRVAGFQYVTFSAHSTPTLCIMSHLFLHWMINVKFPRITEQFQHVLELQKTKQTGLKEEKTRAEMWLLRKIKRSALFSFR